MRTLYQEKIIKCGRFQEVDIYPVFPAQRSRGKKKKPSSEVQRKLNEKYAKKKISYLVNTNFTDKDIRLDLTYDAKHLPKDEKDAQHQVQLFIRRVNRARRRAGLPDLKYIYVTETGARKGRIHHHIIMSGGIDVNTLASLWGKGYTTVKPLQFDHEYGCTALAEYLVKQLPEGRRWNCSKNLKQPEIRTRTGKVSRHRAFEWLQQGMDCRKEIEKYYGMKLADIKPFFNEVNRGVYITLSLYEPVKRQRKKGG